MLKRDQSRRSYEINTEVRKFDNFLEDSRTGSDFGVQRVGARLNIRRMAKRVYVVAGELSGDAHAAGLLQALQGRVADLEIRGAGGPEMRAVAGAKVEDWVQEAAVMGVWEVLKRYGWFQKKFAEMLEVVEIFQPELLLLVDYPGFNLRFAEAVRREFPQIKIVYYISPKVWAWNKGRIPVMARVLDEVLCLFPFEQPIFENAGLKSTFVGNPLVDELEAQRLAGAMRDEKLVGIFPGSREHEIARLFPLMVEAAKLLKATQEDLEFEVPAASAALARQILGILEAGGVRGWIAVTEGGSHSLMQRASCAVIASGTATLEAAYYGLPYCLVYRVAPLTYVLARLLVEIEFIGLVNILAGEGVVEELIQDQAQPAAVARALADFLKSSEKRQSLQRKLAATTAKLGGTGAHERAAAAVAQWLG